MNNTADVVFTEQVQDMVRTDTDGSLTFPTNRTESLLP